MTQIKTKTLFVYISQEGDLSWRTGDIHDEKFDEDSILLPCDALYNPDEPVNDHFDRIYRTVMYEILVGDLREWFGSVDADRLCIQIGSYAVQLSPLSDLKSGVRY